MSDTKFKVGIIGAGIGGLTFAVALHRACKNVSVDIYESSSQFTEIGAGIGLWPRAWEVMKHIGLEDDLTAICSGAAQGKYQAFTYHKADQEAGISFYESTNRVGFASFHRADFQHVLSEHLPVSYKVLFSKRLKAYTVASSGAITLEFVDSSTAKCDVLVGCDGIKSAVRSTLYESLAQKAERAGDHTNASRYRSETIPQFTGTMAYRGLAQTAVLQSAHPDHPALAKPLMCFGKNKHIVVYPVSQNRFINVAAFVSAPHSEGTIYDQPWVRQCTNDEVVAQFDTWEPDVKNLLKCLENASAWAINTLPSLSTYVDCQVALVGDAAHAMAPHQGSGAGQAAEDGFILATILGHSAVTLETLPRALQIYDEIRRPFTQKVLRTSREMGLHYDFNSPRLEVLTEEASAAGAISVTELETLGQAADKLMEWVGGTSVMSDHQRALQMVEGILGSTA